MIELENLTQLAPSLAQNPSDAGLPEEHIVELGPDHSSRLALSSALIGPFEKITRLASRLFDVPASAISLAHEHIVWHQFRLAIPAEPSCHANPEREISAFMRAYASGRDAAPDFYNFDEAVMLGGLAVRFCAAVPLVSGSGEHFGTLCLLDSKPRRLEEFEVSTLADLAAIAADEVEFRAARSGAGQGGWQTQGQAFMEAMSPATSLHDAVPEAGEERYQSLLGLLSDWHWEQDTDGRFTLIAEAGRINTPDKFSAYIGKTLDAIPAASMPEKARRQFDQAMLHRQPFQEVIVQWQEDGEAVRYLSLTGQPIFSREGCFRGYRGVTKDVTENFKLQAELARSNAALRQLSDAQQVFREAERKRIARELHDELAQLLATSRMELCMLQRDLKSASLTYKRLDSVDRMIGTSIVSLRKLATDLRPSCLDEGGLYYALRSLSKTFSENAGAECHLIANEADLAMDEVRSTAIFRLLEECLSNIAQHADARKVVLQIRRNGKSMELRVQDDGRGIRKEEMHKANTFGLMEMRERVRKMKGRICIEGLAGKGTRIAISLPQFFQP